VHGACAHGAVPSTNASSTETNVTEVAVNFASTGPPVVAAVAVGVSVAVAVTGRLAVADAVPALAVLVGAADRPAVLELPVPHAVSATVTASAAGTSARRIAHARDGRLLMAIPPAAGRQGPGSLATG
jgi:hypothetical protein